MVVKVRGEGTIFENSPKKTQADVRHEFVPEIKVASMILTDPDQVDKFREVSSKLKQDDIRLRSTSKPSEIKRELSHQSGFTSSEPVKRVKVSADEIERRPLLARDDRIKEAPYVLDPGSNNSNPESRLRRWARSFLFCCFRQR